MPTFPGTSAKIDAATGDITLAAAVAGKPIQINGLILTTAIATTIQLKDGNTALTGAMNLPAAGQLILPLSDAPWFVTTVGNAFVLTQGGTVQISGRVYYTVGP